MSISFFFLMCLLVVIEVNGESSSASARCFCTGTRTFQYAWSDVPDDGAFLVLYRRTEAILSSATCSLNALEVTPVHLSGTAKALVSIDPNVTYECALWERREDGSCGVLLFSSLFYCQGPSIQTNPTSFSSSKNTTNVLAILFPALLIFLALFLLIARKCRQSSPNQSDTPNAPQQEEIELSPPMNTSPTLNPYAPVPLISTAGPLPNLVPMIPQGYPALMTIDGVPQNVICLTTVPINAPSYTVPNQGSPGSQAVFFNYPTYKE